ncbi:MAG: methyltransferase domain-containing protein [Mariprofundales bacterium]
MSMQNSVLERYSEGAKQREATLCCPVDYDTSLLKLLPQEIIDRDYGCGDPSRYVQQGDTVLDLGSGGGKICYMAAQLVGEHGKVIGVDMNDDMLALARSHQAAMADKLGGDRVSFIKGYIQDLALDLAATERWLNRHPITGHEGVAALTRFQNQQKGEQPLIADQSIDLIISNCVLNLVDSTAKPAMFDDIFRVLRPGGRVAISDIVSDQVVPQTLMDDPELWSGCISGAMEEGAFIQAFNDAGLTGVRIDKWDAAPWQVVEGIAFRSVTITAYKPAGDASSSGHDHTVIYRGPFAHLTTDSGLRFVRGERTSVNRAVFNTLAHPPYHNDFITLTPDNTDEAGACCGTSGCC